jgi:hypothetical protein
MHAILIVSVVSKLLKSATQAACRTAAQLCALLKVACMVNREKTIEEAVG